MSTARPEIPPCLAHLPVWRGMPVPWVAAWSSEGRTVVRYDPHAGGVAIFNRGRLGRGRPVFGVMSPERQRAAILTGRCQLCGRHLDDLDQQPEEYTAETGWLPNHPKLTETTDQAGTQYFLEPPCHRACAEWAAIGCPGIRGTVTDLIEILEVRPLAQLLDLSDAANAFCQHPDRFDDQETDASAAHLAAQMRRHPHGVIGYVRYSIGSSEKHDLC